MAQHVIDLSEAGLGGASVPAGSNPQLADLVPAQATTDQQLLGMWLHGRSRHTARAYEADARAFLDYAGKPLREVTVADLQAWGATLAHLSPASIHRRLSAVKSLAAFGHRLGYLPFNVGAPVRLPPVKNTLAERIVSESAVFTMLALETDPRNKALLTLLYRAGLRISEAAGLCWRDLAPRDDAGQVTVFGKGGKTRVVLLPASTWRMLAELRERVPQNEEPTMASGKVGHGGSVSAERRESSRKVCKSSDRSVKLAHGEPVLRQVDAKPSDPVFRSAKGGHLDPSAIHRIVKAAAKRANIAPELSAHWLRHAHASHALDRGCPIHLAQATLGHASVATTGRYLHARPNDSSARFLAG